MTITRVLIANRGEIACRVIDSVRALGLESVAVYSDADAKARHVNSADTAVRIGPAKAAESYLNVAALIAAAQRAGADAIHPGYGFLSENAAFARACDEAQITFIGPLAETIATMGDKIAARAAVEAQQVPTVPGIARPGLSDIELIAAAEQIGYPVLVKPSAGGGGKGMRRVEEPGELPAALASARREAAAAFGDDTLFLERFVATPRHIEVQVLADRYGHVVGLGERECSLQRRHQKIIEEAPSPLLDNHTRERIVAAACAAARSVGYLGAGTVEFIVSADKPEEFFFMEMNTRLQVEHPVTELVTGLDLVALQIQIAAGQPLPFTQGDVTMTGHAIEARIYAEDATSGFLPTGGQVLALREPRNARIDSGLSPGMVVGTDYDPLLAKVIAHGPTRDDALANLDRALAETAVLGVGTNVDVNRFILALPEVLAGNLDTGLVERRLTDYQPTPPTPAALIAGALASRQAGSEPAGAWDQPWAWRLCGYGQIWTRLAPAGSGPVLVGLQGTGEGATATITDGVFGRTPSGTTHAVSWTWDGGLLFLTVDTHQQRWVARGVDDALWVAGQGGCWRLDRLPILDSRTVASTADGNQLHSPMPGTVIAVHVREGAQVTAGEPVLTVEAMKMEHTLNAPVAGRAILSVAAGEQVRAGALLAQIDPTAPTEQEVTNGSE